MTKFSHVMAALVHADTCVYFVNTNLSGGRQNLQKSIIFHHLILELAKYNVEVCTA